MRRFYLRVPTLVVVIYLIVGIFVAADRNYLSNVDSFERFLSAILAVLVWWMLLLGIDLHVDI